MEPETGSGDWILRALWTHRLVAFHFSVSDIIFCLNCIVSGSERDLPLNLFRGASFTVGLLLRILDAKILPENSNAPSNILITRKG